ncbi:MAG: tRNA (adenosine(37)-N6)-threonylcarbamoyltransferase complex ATPase subunit type 1 TsaE [Patescibacteria group bacterium]|nr:tRNA (adenosine(37)-N6)-threonylcarbamoyltransferase complex ATPase subunit type 1 TsaE [Patescibacteria group bacterium]
MSNNKKIYVTESAGETQKLALDLAKTLKGGEVIALYGNLGGGKTTFTQGLALGLGIKRRIISPTFIIVRTYKIKIKNQKSKIKTATKNPKLLYHIDLYRTDSKEDFEEIGMQDIIKDEGSIKVIEWAEKIKDFLPKKRIDIYFEYIGGDRRKITFKIYE